MPRLGELLVQAGAVTGEQVQAALARQQRHGGRLGSHLVEMGYLSETALALTLSRQLRLPAVTAAALEHIPEDVIGLLPRDTAVHHRCIPVRLEGQALCVAMSDPTDGRALAEVWTLSRRTVRAMVAPDILVSYALERHYGVPWHRIPPDDQAAPFDLRIEESPPVGPFDADYTTAERAAIAARVQRLDERRPEGRLGTSQLAQRLAVAQSQREVFQAMLSFLGQDFARSAVVVRRGDALRGFLADGPGVDSQALLDFAASPGEVALLDKVLADGRPRLGRASAQTLGGLVHTLGSPGDQAVLVMPMRCGSESVGVVVSVGGREGVEGIIDEYFIAGGKLNLALQILALRQRLTE